MKKNLLRLAAVVFAVGLSSCYYDPYYTSVGGSYSSGYGDGYGYGGSSFSTSVFVSTGDSRWGYDPYCYSYYDYRSRRYYDPYLNGYYPVGYRPPVVYGVPHPHGWRPGHGYIRPPGYVSGGMIRNYRDREAAYRGTRYGWARQVRQAPSRSQPRVEQQRPYGRPDQGRPSGGNYRQDQFSVPNRGQSPGRTSPGRQETRSESGRTVVRYNNTPVTSSQRYGRQESGRQMSQGNPGRRQEQSRGGGGGNRGGGGGNQGRQEEGKGRLR